MKQFNYLFILCLLFITGILSAQQEKLDYDADSTGLPGDHFSLQGALDLFKNAKSLEEFEKQLNTEGNAVNNLDLNGDGDIDYVRVVDNKDKDVHAIVLQVPVNENENQDIAVIEIEKNGNESAMLQIVGDEELYGDNTIVEPFDDKPDREGGKSKMGPSVYSTTAVIVNVWLWPSVRFIYAPAYVVWISPWRWHHYPGWWRPWRPHPWRWHYAHTAPFRVHYNVVHTHRVVVAHKFYAPRRTTSVVVNKKYKVVHETHIEKRNKRDNRHDMRDNNRPERNNERINPRENREHNNMERGGGKTHDRPNKVRKGRRG